MRCPALSILVRYGSEANRDDATEEIIVPGTISLSFARQTFTAQENHFLLITLEANC